MLVFNMPWVEGTQCVGASSATPSAARAQRSCKKSRLSNRSTGARARAAASTPWGKWRRMKSGLTAAT
jgi:hypothetical protein